MISEKSTKIIFIILRIIGILILVFFFTGITYNIINNAYFYEENGIKYRLYRDSKTAEVVKSPNANGKVTVPSVVINKNKQYNVTTIKQNAFYENNNIQEIIFSEGIKIIERESIPSKISKISVPNSIESFKNYSIKVDESNLYKNGRYIGNEENPYVVLISYDERNATDVTLCDGLRVIASSIFSHYPKLKSVFLPDTLVSIEEYAFRNCSELSYIWLPDSLLYIEQYAFYECTKLKNIYISENSNLQYFANYSLVGLESLESLYIPRQCRSIGNGYSNAHYTSRLNNISVHNDNEIYDSREDCNAIIETKTNKLLLGCKNSTILESVETLGYECFKGVSFNDPELYLPNTIRKIDTEAFAFTNLKKVILNESCEEIGSYVFMSCEDLETLVINKNIKTIGNGICYKTKKLKKLVIPFIGENFNSKKSLSYFFNIYNRISDSTYSHLSVYISPRKDYTIRKSSIDMILNEVYFLNNVKEIKSEAFYFGQLNNIYISKSVTKVGKKIISIKYEHCSDELKIYLESQNLGIYWNKNWNSVSAKLQFDYDLDYINYELEQN